MFNKDQKKTMKKTATLILAIIFIISGIIIVFVGNYFIRKYFAIQVKEDIAVTVEQVTKNIDVELKSTEQLMVELATNQILHSPIFSKTERASFYEEKAKKLGFKVFFYIDLTGKAQNLDKEGKEFNVFEREYFKRAVQGEVYTSNIILNKSDNGKIIVVSVPHYVNNKVVGVLAGIKNINFIGDMCANFELKKSGILAVYDENTVIVGHTNAEIIGTNILEAGKTDENFKDFARFFEQKILQQESGNGEYKTLGNDKFASYRRLKNRGLYVLISIDKHEIFAPLFRLNIILFVVTGLLLLVSLSLSYFLAAKLSQFFMNIKQDIEKLAEYESSESAVLLPLSPLRTVRESFPSYGSSIL